MNPRFKEIIRLINQSRINAIRIVNTELINLYWNVGAYISRKIEITEWGESVVKELAEYIQQNEPQIKGFSDKNLWRMKQFYEVYRDFPILSTVLREISWSNNLVIFSRCKTYEERAFYLKLCKQESYSFRMLDRQISAGIFERTILGNMKFSETLKETNNKANNTFRDTYIFEFLNLTANHNESDLQHGLVLQMKAFVLELGRDFIFIGEEYKIQVGNSDFFIDLLFYHRGYRNPNL